MGDLTIEGLFNGLPLLSNRFDTTKFITAVACARRKWHSLISCSTRNLSDFLDPENAGEIYATILGKQYMPGKQNLTPFCVKQINRATEIICNRRPLWKDYFVLNYKFFKIDDEKIIGYSSAAKPQHIYLGNQSWVDILELSEQILHEISHVWLYMLEELWAFQTHKNLKIYTLPSGISNKNATGVLNAAFVACVLSKYYEATSNKNRVEMLRWYGSKSLDLLNNSKELTKVGCEIKMTLVGHLKSSAKRQ